jgi:hypothetical protein
MQNTVSKSAQPLQWQVSITKRITMMEPNLRELGRVKITQVQPSGLIYEVPGGYHYDPSRRVEVSRLLLSARGVEGVDFQDQPMLDIHHADHPHTSNNGNNGISIGFTSHYRKMRTRFGEHMRDGTAGENIIIDTDQEIWLADLGQQVEFHNLDTGNILSLEVVKIAAPCDEFSHFAAKSQEERLEAKELKDTLQFLGGGRRGFLLKLSGDQEKGYVQPGDVVYSVNNL